MAHLTLAVGVKTDPVQYRFSYPWLFRLMADEGIQHAQLGSFFEMYQLPDEFFIDLQRQAASFGVVISGVFTTHRELGGFFRPEIGWHDAAFRSFRRMIEVGALVGATSVGGNPGSVLRDDMGFKATGLQRYLDAMKTLMGHAHRVGVPWLALEPMSCLAEPPTLPAEMAAIGEELDAWHDTHPATTARVGFCVDVAHGYRDAGCVLRFDNMQLFEAALPYTQCVHLKNTDERFEATFGFGPADRARGIVDIGAVRECLLRNATRLPVSEVIGYLEIGGPKLGRDYSDHLVEGMLRDSLRYLRDAFAGRTGVADCGTSPLAEGPGRGVGGGRQ